jgi:hypothetical protein
MKRRENFTISMELLLNNQVLILMPGVVMPLDRVQEALVEDSKVSVLVALVEVRQATYSNNSLVLSAAEVERELPIFLRTQKVKTWSQR